MSYLYAKVAAVILSYVLIVIIRRIYFHPLSKYPGPFLGKFTHLHVYASVINQDRTLQQHRLLQKYGSPVRFATDQLIFADKASWTDIYGQSSALCLKDPAFWGPFSVTGAENVLNCLSRTRHARIRRLLSHGFALKSLLQTESMFAEKVDIFINQAFAPYCDKPAVDIHEKIHEHYLDIISHLSFGKSFNTVSGENPHACHDVDEFPNYVPAISFFPLSRYLPIPKVQEGRAGMKRLETFSREVVTEFIEKHSKENDEKRDGFLGSLVDAVDPETGTKLSMEELVENTIIFLIAGEGTSAVTTIYMLWEVGRRPDVRKKLVDEIRNAFPDRNAMPTYDKASKLKYFTCILDETLRLYGPLHVAKPHVSPGRMISGKYIPKDIVVSTVGYTTSRDPKIFDRAKEFIPERWLNATPDMRAMHHPFGVGPRNCIGRHVAEIGLTLTLCRIFQLYDLTVDECMTPEVMEPRDRGILEPIGQKLVVNLRTPAGVRV